jgi:uncharacterized protein (TIGR02444 family)
MTAADDLWTWAVAAYGKEGVAETCLTLQDREGQCVPLLLFGTWVATTGRALDDEAVEAACDTAKVWQDAAIAPLRAVRRTLKKPQIDMAAAAREDIRAHVKAVELNAERRLLDGLAALAGPAGDPRPVLPDLVRLSRAWGETLPRAALERLAERLAA